MPEFKGLELSGFFAAWLRSYGELAAFSVEYIPTLYTVLIALVTNSIGLVNVYSIEREVAKDDKVLALSFEKIEQAVRNLASRRK